MSTAGRPIRRRSGCQGLAALCQGGAIGGDGCAPFANGTTLTDAFTDRSAIARPRRAG